jgi:hypothetical protein
MVDVIFSKRYASKVLELCAVNDVCEIDYLIIERVNRNMEIFRDLK